MIKTFKKIQFDIPPEMEARFEYWIDKIDMAKRENHNELYHGCLVAFKKEFREYKRD